MKSYVHRMADIAKEVGICLECPALSTSFIEAQEIDKIANSEPNPNIMQPELRFSMLAMRFRSLHTYIEQAGCDGPINNKDVPIPILSEEAKCIADEAREMLAKFPELASTELAYACPAELEKSRNMQKMIYGDGIRYSE